MPSQELLNECNDHQPALPGHPAMALNSSEQDRDNPQGMVAHQAEVPGVEASLASRGLEAEFESCQPNVMRRKGWKTELEAHAQVEAARGAPPQRPAKA